MSNPTLQQAEGSRGAPTPLSQITQILTPAELDKLRGGFTPAGVLGPSRDTLVGTFPPIEGYADAFLAYHFYEGSASPGAEVSTLSPLERERVLITLMAVRLSGNGRFFGIHLYWGLMLGLSPRQIADQIFLVGVYSGLEVYTAAMATYKTLLLRLKERVAKNEVEASSILAATAQWFPVS